MEKQRLNKFLADNTNLSRRMADKAISSKQVKVNGKNAELGMLVNSTDKILLDDCLVTPAVKEDTTLILNKPVDYVCSKRRHKDLIVYDLLPHEYVNLKIAGRLDKDSTGLVVLTNSGQSIYQLTHPKFNKSKIYFIKLNRKLSKKDCQKINREGVDIGDKSLSKFLLEPIQNEDYQWKAILKEGRNRQIRRTFELLGYKVEKLHRIQMGDYLLGDLNPGEFKIIPNFK